VRILRASDRVPAPWKNGGGVTREVAVHPPGAGLDDFDWRVSLATVATGGPFSRFPGIDRSLSVLEGLLTLKIGDGPTTILDPTSDPLAFPGDVAASAQTPPRPVTDFNIMTRRGRIGAEVTRLRFTGNRRLLTADWTLVLACAPMTIAWNGELHTLDAHDVALVENVLDHPDLDGVGPAHVLLARLYRL